MTTSDPRSNDPFRPTATSEETSTYPVEPTVKPRGGGGMLLNVALGIALVVAVGGVAFGIGRATAPAAPAGAGGFVPGAGGFVPGAGNPTASGAPGGFNGGLGAGGLSIQGTVTAVGADSVTLQLASGQSMTIQLDAATTFHERAAATAADVTAGATVIVQLQGGRGAFGQGGQGGQGNGPAASGAPGRDLGAASTVTIVPPGS